MSNFNNPRIPGSRRLKRTAERDAEAVKLWAQGKSYREIADNFGWAVPDTACDAVTRGLRDRGAADLDTIRAVENAKLDAVEQKLWPILSRTHYVYASGTGQVVTDPATGEPLTDDGPVIAASAALVRVFERRARLNGADAARRAVLTIEMVDREIRELEAEIAARGRGLPVPGELRAIEADRGDAEATGERPGW